MAILTNPLAKRHISFVETEVERVQALRGLNPAVQVFGGILHATAPEEMADVLRDKVHEYYSGSIVFLCPPEPPSPFDYLVASRIPPGCPPSTCKSGETPGNANCQLGPWPQMVFLFKLLGAEGST